jgi:hypothetical protein
MLTTLMPVLVAALYEATLCIWLLSFHDGAFEAFSTARVVPRLVEVVKSSTKEKVLSGCKFYFGSRSLDCTLNIG